MATSYLTEAVPKKPEPGAKAVDIAASIVDRVFIYFFALILLLCLYAIYDALMVYREAELPVAVREYTQKDSDSHTSGVDFNALKELNGEIVGWIQLDDTDVDFPITQADNNSYYLSRSYTKDYSLAGSIFLDYRNTSDFTDDYNLIYGHNMNGEMMFGGLHYFSEASYFESHRTGRLLTPEANYDLEIVAALKTDRMDARVYELTFLKNYHNDEIAAYLKEKATQSRNLDTLGDKQIIALSTCFDKDGGRVIVFASYNKAKEKPASEPDTDLTETLQ